MGFIIKMEKKKFRKYMEPIFKNIYQHKNYK